MESHAADQGTTGASGDGFLAKRFPGVNIGNVNFHGGLAGGGNRVSEGHARVGETARVDDKGVHAGIGPCCQLVNDGSFVIGLQVLDGQAEVVGQAV